MRITFILKTALDAENAEKNQQRTGGCGKVAAPHRVNAEFPLRPCVESACNYVFQFHLRAQKTGGRPRASPPDRPQRARYNPAMPTDEDPDRSTAAAPPPRAAQPLPAALRCMALAMLGLLLALTAVWLGTGWLDGFDYRHTNRLGRRFLRALPWALPLAALGGALLYTYFRWAIAETHKGWVLFIAVIRAFALFPLLGFAILMAMLFAIAAAIPLGLYRKFTRKPAAADSLMARLMGVPIWIMTLPFTLLGIESEGDIEIPARVSPSRLLNWLPFFFLLLLVGPGAESEASGERIDPNWLAAFAAYWLADCLIVTGYVAPALSARARCRRLAALGR